MKGCTKQFIEQYCNIDKTKLKSFLKIHDKLMKKLDKKRCICNIYKKLVKFSYISKKSYNIK